MTVKIEVGKKYYFSYGSQIYSGKCLVLTENGGLFRVGFGIVYGVIERHSVLAEKPPLFSCFKSKPNH